VPTGTLRIPWLRLFRAFSSVVRQIPGYNSQLTTWSSVEYNSVSCAIRSAALDSSELACLAFLEHYSACTGSLARVYAVISRITSYAVT